MEKKMNRLSITKGCMVAGQPCREGETVLADDETAYDLLNLGYAEPADAFTTGHVRSRMRYGWIDREEDQRPKLRLMKST